MQNKLENIKKWKIPESGSKFHEDVSDLISHGDTHTLQSTEFSTRYYTIYLEKIKILISIQSTRHYTIYLEKIKILISIQSTRHYTIYLEKNKDFN